MIGCTDAYSFNFNPNATVSCSGCCLPYIFGCQEPFSGNYAPDAEQYWYGVYNYQINYAIANDLAPVTSTPVGYVYPLGDNAYSMLDASGTPCMTIDTSDWDNPGIWTINPDAVGCDFHDWTCTTGTLNWRFHNYEDDMDDTATNTYSNAAVFPHYLEPTE